MTQLKGKVALVTGGGGGIGTAICRRLARDGARVAVVDVDRKAVEKVSGELKRFGGKSLPVCADVSLKASVEEMVRRVMKEWKKIDILVNCAAIARITPFIDIPEEEFDRVCQVNLKGVFLCTQRVAREMMKRRSGKIVNVSSLAGRRAAEFLGAYTSAKFGVIGLTQTTALELARYGITCNAVAPGFIDTPLWDLRDRRVAEIRGLEKINTLEIAVKNVPMGRAGSLDQSNLTPQLRGPNGRSISAGTSSDYDHIMHSTPSRKSVRPAISPRGDLSARAACPEFSSGTFVSAHDEHRLTQALRDGIQKQARGCAVHDPMIKGEA